MSVKKKKGEEKLCFCDNFSSTSLQAKDSMWIVLRKNLELNNVKQNT